MQSKNYNRIYLSGNMTPNAKYYNKWCENMKFDIMRSDINASVSKAKIESTIDPKFIVHHDIARLSRCDLVVVNFGVDHEDVKLTGAIVEVYEAFKQNKAVYAFTGQGKVRSPQANSPWIQQFITKEFESYDELLDFLSTDNL